MLEAPYNGFHFYHLLAISVVLLLGFFVAGKIYTRSAWYVALSAPGALAFIYFLISVFSDLRPYAGNIPLHLTMFFSTHAIFLPAMWIWPIITIVHARMLFLGRTKKLAASSGIWCLVLVAMYFYSDYVDELLTASFKRNTPW